jgi:hypothetical protein
MFAVQSTSNLQQTTSHKVVLPFYVYAAVSILVASVLLVIHADEFQSHYFQPHVLTITHIMALGWGTMIIFGASHQLVPVIIEGKLASNLFAYLTFAFCAIGIPILSYGFYTSHFKDELQCGAVLVNIGVLCYLINVLMSIVKSSKRDIHAWFLLAAVIWLFSTTMFGMLLVFNFTYSVFPQNSLAYLTAHAHLGIVGWFLLLILGVGSRLIPMFLISKYTNNRMLWQIFVLVNSSLILFLLTQVFQLPIFLIYLSVGLTLFAIVLFVVFCKKAHHVRIRKSVDEQMKISLISVMQMLLPVFILFIVLLVLPLDKHLNIAILYGYTIFFGWITAIIFGMTFKTLPFIVWNRVYSNIARDGKTPSPKELFNSQIFTAMLVCYLSGFLLFGLGLLLSTVWVLKIGAGVMLLSACLYVLNVGITIFHKAK